MIKPLVTAALLLAVAATVHAAPQATSLKGKLLIIGGNIGNNGPMLYQRMLEGFPANATVGVIPTASGEPDTSMNNAAERITLVANGRVVKGIRITEEDASRADDAGLAEQIDACSAIFFTGGQQDRIVNAFHPGGKDTRIAQAVNSVLERGGIVAGTSAGAAIMCDPMILGGDSAAALAGKKPLPIGKGMGYFPWGVVDQHFLERGRFGRLIVAAEQTKQDFGYGISEGRGMYVDRETAQMAAVGSNAILMLDRRSATHDPATGERTGLRVSLLQHNDAVNAITGQITPAAARTLAEAKARDGASEPIKDAWARNAIRDLMKQLAKGTNSQAVAFDETYELTFSVDEQTQVSINPNDDLDLTIVNLRLDMKRR